MMLEGCDLWDPWQLSSKRLKESSIMSFENVLGMLHLVHSNCDIPKKQIAQSAVFPVSSVIKRRKSV